MTTRQSKVMAFALACLLAGIVWGVVLWYWLGGEKEGTMITRAWRVLRVCGAPVLLCLVCDRWSAHPMDIRERYCGYCHLWLDEVPMDWRSPLDPSRAAPDAPDEERVYDPHGRL